MSLRYSVPARGIEVRRSGLNTRASGVRQHPEIVVQEWHAKVDDALTFTATGLAVRKDGTLGYRFERIYLPASEVPTDVYAALLVGLAAEAARQRADIDLARATLDRVAAEFASEVGP